jgi:succinate dehydrogenase/fumarate reductase flavoprotein subunit
MREKNGLSRRDFLKGAAVTASGAAVMAIAGCDTNSPAADTGGTTGTASTGLPASWDQEVDVVVVGTGCGLAAAIEAKEAGADTIILEKNDFVGGLFITAGGNSIWGGTHVQAEYDVIDNKEDWYQDELYGCHHRGNVELIRTYVDRAEEMCKWYEDLGMVWATKGSYQHPNTNRVVRTHFPGPSTAYEGGRGFAYTKIMHDRVNELDVPILFKHRMTKVWRDGDGPVVGVEVSNETGTINIKTRKAVILCTGTWTDNERLAALYDPRIVGPDTYGDGGTPGDGTLFVDSSGDGHIAAAQVGAAFTDMSFVCYLYIFFGSRSYWGWEPADFTVGEYLQSGKGINRSDAFYRSTILVKNDGKRYVNESLGAYKSLPWAENRALPDPDAGEIPENPEWPFTAAYLNLLQPRNVWAIGDATIAAALEWPLDVINNPDIKSGAMFDPECIAIADTLDDLAAKMKVDAAGLKQTIATYNGYADSGTDADFGKPGPLSRIETAPFYGFKASMIRHTQRNGARVNTKSQVIALLEDPTAVTAWTSIDDEPVIPHLYAAGELGNVMGYRRMHGSLGNYALFARIAGENAAKETSI